jgi:hypothetical protein
VTAVEVRELADRLVALSDWCHSRRDGDDQYAYLAAKAPRWASELHSVAHGLEHEELAQ